MPLYLSILEGPDPFEARPLMSSSDPDLIAAVAEILAARLGARVPGHVLDMRHVQNGSAEDANE